VFPTRVPNGPPGPTWVRRLVAVCMLGVTVAFALAAVNEARINPDCNPAAAAGRTADPEQP